MAQVIGRGAQIFGETSSVCARGRFGLRPRLPGRNLPRHFRKPASLARAAVVQAEVVENLEQTLLSRGGAEQARRHTLAEQTVRGEPHQRVRFQRRMSDKNLLR